eukprot:TRINITY_DN47984_c0_g1_i1.p1 TRINITY_DN47984_c0_g1~~TRINITY_DN47984_c0_g1_i1.p1  ORF type:complete len:756 (+),score=141.52 TRINITY_DN47984_c0_g1_i1:2450-4717(+)
MTLEAFASLAPLASPFQQLCLSFCSPPCLFPNYPRPIRTCVRRRRMSTMQAERILWATNLTKSHDGRINQVTNLSLDIPAGAKLALLGRSGVGKSTLLSILAGVAQPDKGTVTLRRGASLAYVSQTLPQLRAENALHAVMTLASRYTNNEAVRAALHYSSVATRAQHRMGDDCLQLLADATARMDQTAGAWETESYMNSALSRLQVPLDVPLSKLSGGQKRRIAIAAALVAKPDVLLLDEVTNHLSIDAVQFVEEVLADPYITVLAISHDRFFVDRVCTSGIWELEGELVKYGAGYDAFLEQKSSSLLREEKELSDLAKAYKKELEWMKRQPKARASKSKARIADVLNMQEQLKLRKERLAVATVKDLRTTTSRLGSEVVRVENVSLKRGDKIILQDFSYTFERGERMGIVGGNGVGKSSFIELLLGKIAPENGQVHIGETVKFGHFDQEGEDISERLLEAARVALRGEDLSQVRVVDYVKELLAEYGDMGEVSSSRPSGILATGSEDAEQRLANEIEKLSYSVTVRTSKRTERNSNPLARMQATTLLEHFGFGREKHYNFVCSLSGGEKRRLQLIALLLQNANFMLLDEVSNDLDLNTLTMLEELLAQYSGVLVMCSHDRFMLDRLVDHLLVFEGDGQVALVEGKFTDYLEAKRQLEAEEKKVRKKSSAQEGKQQQKGEQPRRLSYKEKREFEGLEAEIERLHEQHAHLSELMAANAGGDYAALVRNSAELAAVADDIEAKTERWLMLAEIAGD